MKRVAVVGGGITGLGAALELAKAGLSVCLYEKEEILGGRLSKTVTIDGVELDLAFMPFSRVTCPNTMELFDSLGIEMEDSDMSFSVRLDKGMELEWGNRHGLSSFFAYKGNLLNPYFWKMLWEVNKFKDDVMIYLDELENNTEMDRNETLESFIKSRGYSELFQTAYLIPLCASHWPCHTPQIMSLSAFSILSCFRNHHLIQLFGGPQWIKVKGRFHCYVNKVKKELMDRGCVIRTNCEVNSVLTSDKGCTISLDDGSVDNYNGCILAIHALDALKLLGNQATNDERRILGAFQYVYSDVFLHQDESLMPRHQIAWSAWNFLGSSNNQVSLTYWLNVMQNIHKEDKPFLASLNPFNVPKNVLLKWSAGHPIPSIAASKALVEIDNIQGKRGIWFCGTYQGFGFHEDGLKAAMVVAHRILGRNYIIMQNPKEMVTSWLETAARHLVSSWLRKFLSTGCLTIIEDGGKVLTFEGTRKECAPTVAIRVHNPQFYWKVSTEADLGVADAYINGDFSLVNKDDGLLNLFMLFIANKDLNSSSLRNYNIRGWWTPKLFMAGLSSIKYFYNNLSRRNTPTQARKNISRHYDLSNDMFSLFLDETMTYSCAIFKSIDEDLKDAQLRKLFVLIKKAKIEKNHEVLDIGCGWGSLAIEAVRHTGCKYTGITLSKEQLSFAKKRVKDAGLQDRIEFLLCDYRQLPHDKKYDRIISCGMIEHVGHEYMEAFFHSCDSVLVDNGLLVLQFVAYQDECYNEYRQNVGFMSEYIFPGGLIPSLSRVTSAMATASRLCVGQVENIGIHYSQTLRCWRQNFLKNEREILALGFDEKFIRTWEYYFDYCAAGFKSRTLLDYQVVYSRPGNVTTFNNPYESIASYADA